MRHFYILSVVLFSLCFYTIISSKCYAWTIDDFYIVVHNVADNTDAPNDFRNYANNLITYESKYKEYFGSNDYNNIIARGNRVYTSIEINNNVLTVNNPTNNYIQFQNSSFKEYYISNNNVNAGGSAGNSTLWYNQYFGLLTLSSDFTFPDNAWFNNRYIPPYTGPTFEPFNNYTQIINGISDIHVENFSRTVSQWQLGTLSNYDENTVGIIEAYNGEGQQWTVISHLFWNGAGEVFVNNVDLLYYQLYRIYFYDIDFNYSPMYGYYFMPMGVSYNGQGLLYSGDYNSIQPILENQEKNQTFWENTYNSLFSMSSGDVNEVYLMVSSYFPSGDTPISVYDTIFGSYNNDPDDFIIRWDDHPLNITWFGGQTLYSGDFIKAGSMNFSKECRDNSVLSNIKFWFNTLFTIFIYIAYYHMLYRCFCNMLGVISEDIEVNQTPEHRPIGFGRGD